MEDLDYIEMRQQMAVLKEHLDNQEIVSDQLLREVMKMKTKDINYTKNAVIGAAVFGLLIIPLSMLLDVWSLPFTIATCLMMVFCAVAIVERTMRATMNDAFFMILLFLLFLFD